MRWIAALAIALALLLPAAQVGAKEVWVDWWLVLKGRDAPVDRIAEEDAGEEAIVGGDPVEEAGEDGGSDASEVDTGVEPSSAGQAEMPAHYSAPVPAQSEPYEYAPGEQRSFTRVTDAGYNDACDACLSAGGNPASLMDGVACHEPTGQADAGEPDC